MCYDTGKSNLMVLYADFGEVDKGGLPKSSVKILDLSLGSLFGPWVADTLEFSQELHGKYREILDFIRQFLKMTRCSEKPKQQSVRRFRQ